MNHAEVLNSIYQGAIALSAAEKFTPNLSEIVASQVEAIVARSESNKGLITVLITLLVHKIVDEKQDIRYHQAQLPNGFSGRTYRYNLRYSFYETKQFSCNGRVRLAYTLP